MDELDELIHNLNTEEYDYYYHITGKGFGQEIIEEGLYLEEPNWNTTMIKVPEEMLQNIYEYCANEYKNSIDKRQEMVIIINYKDEEGSLVKYASCPKWNDGSSVLKYLVSNENILCFIDLETYNITYNPECIDYNFGR